MSDALASDRRLRVLTLMTHFTRKGLALRTAVSLPARSVAEALDEFADERGLPELIVIDNGPEFTGKALDAWAFEHQVRFHLIRPGTPVGNNYCESFNGRSETSS